MRAATRNTILAYAIPVDLVVVATGVGLVVPGMDPLALLGVFVGAVAISAWKSGWLGAIAAMLLSVVPLVLLFKGTVQREQIGWFLAASIIVSIPMAAWFARRMRLRAWAREPVVNLAEPPQIAPVIALQRPVEEPPATVIDKLHVVEREAKARAEGERIAAERFAIEKKKIEGEFARTREQIERGLNERFAIEKKKIEDEFANTSEQIERRHAEQMERRRAELQAAYDRERAELKAKFDESRLGLDAERAELQKQLDEERQRPAVIERYVDEEAIAERLEHLRAELQERFERELQPRIDAELAAQRQALERDTVREIDKARRAADDRVAAFRAELERVLAEQAAANSQRPQRVRQSAPSAQRGLFRRMFQREPEPKLNLSRRSSSGESTSSRRAAAAVAESSTSRRATAAPSGERKARVLFLELRRATADMASPRLKQLGIDVVIVDRLVDAVDELYRFRPDIVFIDADLPDFDVAYKTIAGQVKDMPLVLTSRNASSIPDIGRAGIAIRPYEIDEVVDLARAAVNDPQSLLAKQNKVRLEVPREIVLPPDEDAYNITCYNCRVSFDALDADWCSCLTRERTVVCTNCLTCFCKATPAYKETFWLDAPTRLFERKTAELRRQWLGVAGNLPPNEVKRPLVMLVEHDEDIHALMQRVCANLGYGSVSATNGQDGLELARAYRPNLILTDAFVPKLDGREMCRLLKEDPAFADTKMVVMSALYTDTKFKSEGIDRFRIDDYLAKPVSITDLINLLQRHLEGVRELPLQENLHELHRKEIDGARERGPSTYEVACATCGDMFDAARAEFCTHGRDATLICEHCGNCFCNAPEYRERFWAGAPAVLFERKTIGSVRDGAPAFNLPKSGVKRPLVLLVESDEAIQLMVRTVVSTLGYGFITASNEEEALALAHDYEPELILADAWMPGLDGRKLVRQLKDDPATAQSRAVVMTGRCPDFAWRQEVLPQFKVDDCIAKPLAVGDLIEMVKKHIPQEVQAISPATG